MCVHACTTTVGKHTHQDRKVIELYSPKETLGHAYFVTCTRASTSAYIEQLQQDKSHGNHMIVIRSTS